MKKWIKALLCLGYFTPAFATDHASFLVTGQDLEEMSYYHQILETPNFFTRVYPENLNPNLVLIPRTNSGFMFGLLGFYQRPFDNQLDFAIQDPLPSVYLVSPGSTIHSLKPSDDVGYGAYIGYVYPYTGRDIRLDATNFSSNASDGISATGSGVLWAPNTLYDRAIKALHAGANHDIDIGQAKLMIGQHIFGGTHFHLHPALGVKYAYIDRQLKTNFSTVAGIPAEEPFFFNAQVEEKSRFNGGGPSVELSSQYYFTKNVGLVGHLTSAILIGNIRSENRYTDDEVPSGSAEINQPSTNRVVPNIDGQLGLVFHYPFCGSHTALDFEIGYEFNHFFNAINVFRSTGLFFEDPFHIKQVSDFTLDGPYLSIGVSGISCPNNVVIDPILVTVPRLQGGFIFGIGAGYFRIQHNQLDYGLLDSTAFSFLGSPTPMPTLNGQLKNVEADNAYGGMVTLGYIFQNSPYDIQAHYQQVVATHSDTTVAPPGGVIWTILSTPTFVEEGIRAFAEQAVGRVNIHYHELDLEIAQTINAEPLMWLRVFEGVQAVSINTNFHTTYNQVQNIDTLLLGFVFPQEDVTQKSNFSGIGPRLGFDMTLPFGPFALSSELAGGLLFGNIKPSYSDHWDAVLDPETGLELIPESVVGTRANSDAHTSPFLSLKLALSYGFNFFIGSKWIVDIGYMTTQYFNAATTFRHATNNAAVFVKQVHDVTIAGPYLNVSILGFGACPPDCIVREPFTAFAPILRGGFEFAAEGFYVRTRAPNLDYGIVDPAPEFIPIAFVIPGVFEINPSTHSHVQVLNPDFEFGYRLHLGYIFPLSANDISINFTDYKSSDSQKIVAPPGGVIWTITNGNFSATDDPALLGFPEPFPVVANTAQILADFTWQSGNVELGRRLKFYQLMTRFFAGLSYARIIENITIVYGDGTSLTSPVAPFESIAISTDVLREQNSVFGIGPRFGVAGDLAIDCGFSFVGQIGTDLLVGNIDSELVETASSGFSTALNPDRRTRLIPAFDAKIGFAYTVPLRDCAQIGLEIGYQVNHYFNVKDSLRFTDNFGAFIKQDQDISFDGPYLRLQLSI